MWHFVSGLSYHGQVVCIQYILHTGCSWGLDPVRQEYSSLSGVLNVKTSTKRLSCLPKDLVHKTVKQKWGEDTTLSNSSLYFKLSGGASCYLLISTSCRGTPYSPWTAIIACRLMKSYTLVRSTPVPVLPLNVQSAGISSSAQPDIGHQCSLRPNSSCIC